MTPTYLSFIKLEVQDLFENNIQISNMLLTVCSKFYSVLDYEVEFIITLNIK